MSQRVDLEGNSVKSEQSSSTFELLVLSEAGKPIYSYSKRADAITLMPLCSALMNYAFKTQKESLNSMKTSDNLLITFSSRPPLIIVVLNRCNPQIDPLVIIDQVEAQIVSILTDKTLKSVFQERPTFDLSALLYGSEKLIDSVARLSLSQVYLEPSYIESILAVTACSDIAHDPSLQVGSLTCSTKPLRLSIPILSLRLNIRDSMRNIMTSTVSSTSKKIVFSLLFKVVVPEPADQSDTLSEDSGSDDVTREDLADFIKFKLITVCNHHSEHKLKLADLHLILALLFGTRPQLISVDSLWMPVCLPKFNRDAFLHSYLSMIKEREYCLVMLSVDRNEFNSCHEARNTIETKLDSLCKEISAKSKSINRFIRGRKL